MSGFLIGLLITCSGAFFLGGLWVGLYLGHKHRSKQVADILPIALRWLGSVSEKYPGNWKDQVEQVEKWVIK